MREIAVVSGKGGTGKTTVTGALAVLAAGFEAGGARTGGASARGAVFADCDVAAANLALILRPTLREEHVFAGPRRAVIDSRLCTGCGACVAACRSGALAAGSDGQTTLADPFACEGCAICAHVCPAGAIRMEEVAGGKWFVSDTPHGPLVHARLEPGGENSGKLVAVVRNQARKMALAQSRDLVLIDGPPGIGCPVLATLAGVDLALVVTEPTVTAIADLERVLAVCRHFGVRTAVVINRHDLDRENSRLIEERCAELGVDVAARLPYDPATFRAAVRGLTIVEHSAGQMSLRIRRLWDHLSGLLHQGLDKDRPGNRHRSPPAGGECRLEKWEVRRCPARRNRASWSSCPTSPTSSPPAYPCRAWMRSA